MRETALANPVTSLRGCLNQVHRLKAISENIEYKPHLRLKFEFEYNILHKTITVACTARPPDANAYPFTMDRAVPVIQVISEDVQPWEVFECMSEDDALRFLYMLIERFEQHESGEFFRYKGKKVFDPHA